MDVSKIEKLHELSSHFLKVHKAALAWAGKRADLPPGSTRAKVTSANAKWAVQAESRDRIYEEIKSLLEGL